MTKKRFSILLAVLAVALEVVVIVRLVPVVGSPSGAPIASILPWIALVMVGVVLAIAASVLRKQSQASTQS